MINSLDEAIKHCEELAEEKECTAHSLTKDGWQEHFNNLSQEKEAEYKNVREEMANSCLECASEHRQLAEWLKELKAYKDARVGCEYCKHKYREIHERPCSLCKRNFVDMFEREINADGEIEEDGE